MKAKPGFYIVYKQSRTVFHPMRFPTRDAAVMKAAEFSFREDLDVIEVKE